MSIYIDIHTLTNLGANNVNRGEDGAPKSTYFGDAERQIVSSQALKKAMRDYMRAHQLAPVSIRSRKYVDRVTSLIMEKTGKEKEEADAIARKFLVLTPYLKDATSDKPSDAETAAKEEGKVAIAAFSEKMLDAFSDMALQVESGELSKAEVKKQLKDVMKETRAIDMSLFGTMVAADKSFNVDAAAQVAYGIGVTPFRHEFDFYTAVDDLAGDDESGAAMMGDVQYGTSIIYRFATVNVDALAENLQINREDVIDSVTAFIKAFVSSLPTGKQNAFAARVLPEYVHVSVRDTQPLSMVSAFEKSVPSMDKAVEAFESRIAAFERSYDETPLAESSFRVGDDGSLREMLDDVSEAVRELVKED